MRLAAVLVGLTVALVGLELILGLLGGGAAPPRELAIYEEHRAADPRFPHIRRPPSPPPTARSFRLMVVGDSFTWGTGVYHRDIYARRLESLLERMDRRLDIELSVVSRPGWNTARELFAVQQAVRRKRPQLIVLGYCLNDAEPSDDEAIARMLRPTNRREPQSALGRALFARSGLFGLVWNRLENSRQRRAFERYYHRLYEREGWQQAQQALDGFRQLAWDLEAPLVVALFPVFDQQFDAGYSYASLHETVMAALRQRDILALDLIEDYRGIDTERLAVVPFTDPHPNELAHRIASQRLAHFLVEERLVPISRQQRDRVELSLAPDKVKDEN